MHSNYIQKKKILRAKFGLLLLTLLFLYLDYNFLKLGTISHSFPGLLVSDIQEVQSMFAKLLMKMR